MADSGKALSARWPMPPVLLVPAFTELPAWRRRQHMVGMLVLLGGQGRHLGGRSPVPRRAEVEGWTGKGGGSRPGGHPRAQVSESGKRRMWLELGGEGEDEEGARPVQNEEVGFCPGSKRWKAWPDPPAWGESPWPQEALPLVSRGQLVDLWKVWGLPVPSQVVVGWTREPEQRVGKGFAPSEMGHPAWGKQPQAPGLEQERQAV